MTITIDRGPICECGCGEYLPIGSTRKYKRGHKERVSKEPEANGVFDGYHFRRESQYNTEPIDVDYRNPVGYIDSDGWETIESAADSVPNDPEGAVWDAPDAKNFYEAPRGLQKDIEGKLAFMLSMTGTTWSLLDAECGGSLVDNTPNIARTLTPIICQSPGIVAWFQKTSNVMLYVNLIIAAAPVGSTVINHHIPRRRHQMPQENNGNFNINVDPSHYGVQ